VVAVEGLEHEDLVARVEQRGEGAGEGAGGAERDADLVLEVVVDLVVVRELVGECAAEALLAIEAGVERDVAVDGGLGSLFDEELSGDVADALAHVDTADGVAGPRHCADFGLGEACDAGCDVVAVHGHPAW
jgi:hypothetical protein